MADVRQYTVHENMLHLHLMKSPLQTQSAGAELDLTFIQSDKIWLNSGSDVRFPFEEGGSFISQGPRKNLQNRIAKFIHINLKSAAFKKKG